MILINNYIVINIVVILIYHLSAFVDIQHRGMRSMFICNDRRY